MERTTFNVLFCIRRTRPNRHGEAPIFMIINVNDDRADARLKRFIEPKHWNAAKGKAVENAKGRKDLNLYLDAIGMNLSEEFMWHTYRKKDIYLDELTRRFVEDHEFYQKTERKCARNTMTKGLNNFK